MKMYLFNHAAESVTSPQAGRGRAFFVRTFFAACVLTALSVHAESAAESLKGRVVKVINGDELLVELNDKSRVTVNVAGIDAPTRLQPQGKNAAEYAERFTHGKMVELSKAASEVDSRGYWIVRVGKDELHRKLLEQGLAWFDPRYSKDPGLKNAESDARNLRMGIWKDPRARPPWKMSDFSAREQAEITERREQRRAEKEQPVRAPSNFASPPKRASSPGVEVKITRVVEDKSQNACFVSGLVSAQGARMVKVSVLNGPDNRKFRTVPISGNGAFVEFEFPGKCEEIQAWGEEAFEG